MYMNYDNEDDPEYEYPLRTSRPRGRERPTAGSSKGTRGRGNVPPPIASSPPAASPSSTPDILENVTGLIGGIFSDPQQDKEDEKKKEDDIRLLRDSLDWSYAYFLDKHRAATTDEERTRLLNAANRHFSKSMKTRADFQKIAQSTYTDFLEKIADNTPSEDTPSEEALANNFISEYHFFLDQYNKAKTGTQRENALSTAHRYFSLQYQNCSTERQRAMSAEAYQTFLDTRRTNQIFAGRSLEAPVRLQFQAHLENLNSAISEEERVEAIEAAHQYYIELSNSVRDEPGLVRLNTAYTEFLTAQKESLIEFRETQAMYNAKKGSSSSSRSHSHSSSSRRNTSSSKKITRTRRSSGSPSSRGTGRRVHYEDEDEEVEQKEENKISNVVVHEEKIEVHMKDPWYFIRWMYACLLFHFLFLFAFILIFLFGAFAICWVQFTMFGWVFMILLWVAIIVLIVVLGLCAPLVKPFPWFMIWLVVLTILIAIAMGLTVSFFESYFFLIVIVGILTVLIIVFLVTCLPLSYTPARLVAASVLSWIVCLIAVLLFLFAYDLPFSLGWGICLIIILVVSVWIAIVAAILICEVFHPTQQDEWMFGALCCYIHLPMVLITIACMPFRASS